MTDAKPYDQLMFAAFPSASVEVVSVAPDAPIVKAESLMRRHDFSQLAVTTGPRGLKGAVTWESIARKAAVRRVDRVAECVVDAPGVQIWEPLLDHVSTIIVSGFTFVMNEDRTLGGIVTVYDMAGRFADLARPLVLLAEIEGRLRQTIGRVFGPEDLESIRPPGSDFRPQSPEDLTLGEVVRLLEDPKRWRLLNWNVDRKVFVELLNSVRIGRNRLVHFAEGDDGGSAVVEMERLLRWLRDLDS